MSRTTYFVQECPTCGRSLHVRVVYLGKRVVCRHCHGQFEAHDPHAQLQAPSASGVDLMQRIDELLESADGRPAMPR